jgi:uncharacterized membrane protein
MNDLKKLCMVTYGLYGISAVLQFFEATLLPGLLALVIAYILMRSKREEAKDTPYASHLQWMNRTFWIGTGVIVPVAVIIATVLVLTFTDITAVVTAMNGDNPDAMMGNIQGYIADNMKKVNMIVSFTLVPTVVWWMRRCWTGYALAKEGSPVENVTTWL